MLLFRFIPVAKVHWHFS